jgi:hypothetical protein
MGEEMISSRMTITEDDTLKVQLLIADAEWHKPLGPHLHPSPVLAANFDMRELTSPRGAKFQLVKVTGLHLRVTGYTPPF